MSDDVLQRVCDLEVAVSTLQDEFKVLRASYEEVQEKQRELSDAMLIRQIAFSARSQLTEYVVGGPTPLL